MKLKTYLFKKSVIITLSFLLVFLILEFGFDLAEILLGELLEVTNPVRPKWGTVWELNQKDKIAEETLSEISAAAPDANFPLEIDTPLKLKSILDEQKTVVITAEQFLKIYNVLSPRLAGEIIFPFDLLKISADNKWQWTKITKGETRFSFFFLDGDNQLLMDSYPDLSILYHINVLLNTPQQFLDSLPIFSGRIFSAEQFFKAFNNLPNPIKIQLINNPFQLIKWHQKIEYGAISNTIEANTIQIGFQVATDGESRVYTFQASTIAVNYLIEQLNALYPDLKLTMPGY